MRTAVDTNVLLDLLTGNATEIQQARAAIQNVADSGTLAICSVVYAELAGHFRRFDDLERFIRELGVAVEELSPAALWQAGQAWRTYAQRRGQQIDCARCGSRTAVACPHCGSPLAWRQHVLPDFLIGGHASAQADALLTRDTGYYRTCFPQLRLVASGGPPHTR